MKVLTINETASLLKTSQARIRHFIKTDKSFPYVSYGKKSYRIDVVELQKWFLKRSERAKEGNA
jgi:hypothetical protein